MLNSQHIKANNQIIQVLAQLLPVISVFAATIWVLFLKKINHRVVN